MSGISKTRRHHVEGPARKASAALALKLLTSVAAAFALALVPARVVAQENGDCFICHADKDLSKKRAGKTVSLFVDEKKFATGAHGKVPCIGCHVDLTGAEFPHAETLQKPTCAACHGKEAGDHAAGLHGRAEALSATTTSVDADATSNFRSWRTLR